MDLGKVTISYAPARDTNVGRVNHALRRTCSCFLKHMKRHAATVTPQTMKQKLSPSQSIKKPTERIKSTESTITTSSLEEDDSPSEWELQNPGNLEEVLLGSCSGTNEEEG